MQIQDYQEQAKNPWLLQTKYLKYSTEFISMLKIQNIEKFYHQYELTFYSFSLSKLIQELVRQEFEKEKHLNGEKMQGVLKKVLEDENIAYFAEKIEENWDYQEERKTQKDRKTSFFRTILKFLRSKLSEGGNKGHRTEDDLIRQIQSKLSKNTIAKQAVEKLCEKHGDQIVEYLNSQQAYLDFLNINKSRTNKAFYLLHLRQIASVAKNGKLSEYSFFKRAKLSHKIKSITLALAFDIAAYPQPDSCEKYISNKQTLKTPALPKFQISSMPDPQSLQLQPPKSLFSSEFQTKQDLQSTLEQQQQQIQRNGIKFVCRNKQKIWDIYSTIVEFL